MDLVDLNTPRNQNLYQEDTSIPEKHQETILKVCKSAQTAFGEGHSIPRFKAEEGFDKERQQLDFELKHKAIFLIKDMDTIHHCFTLLTEGLDAELAALEHFPYNGFKAPLVEYQKIYFFVRGVFFKLKCHTHTDELKKRVSQDDKKKVKTLSTFSALANTDVEAMKQSLTRFRENTQTISQHIQQIAEKLIVIRDAELICIKKFCFLAYCAAEKKRPSANFCERTFNLRYYFNDEFRYIDRVLGFDDNDCLQPFDQNDKKIEGV